MDTERMAQIISEQPHMQKMFDRMESRLPLEKKVGSKKLDTIES